MSYPRKLQILVVEDDSEVVEAYRLWFKTAAKDFAFVEPRYARSFNDALAMVRSSDILHVVVLDLNLPLESRTHAAEGLAPGEQLLEAMAKRDSHPIPAVLVVSGKLNLAQPLSDLQLRLGTDFWYGRLINKGLEQYKEIGDGLLQVLRYIDIGIHIRDSGKEWYPTLSPREEDLLRRCALAHPCLGLDLRWWAAENGQSFSQPNPNLGPTKVLMGNFLLDDGLGASLPTFFKFEPAGNGPYVCRDASILQDKLGHVKVLHSLHSRERSLIVTQSVTNKGQPIPLNEYFCRDANVVGPTLPLLLEQVITQLNSLGPREDDHVVASSVFWHWLDPAAIAKTWSTCDTGKLKDAGYPNPLEVFEQLKASTQKLWIPRLRCTHGDMNATNIAIDATQPDRPQAYIFDAAGMQIDFEYRDLATLEITTILFYSLEAPDLLPATQAFYQTEFAPTVRCDATASTFTRNTVSLLTAIRGRFQDDSSQSAYALLLFNAVLQQLSGLSLQPSPNKVRNPLQACQLAASVAGWLKQVSPNLFLKEPGVATSPNTHASIPVSATASPTLS